MTTIRRPWTPHDIAELRRLWKPGINADPLKLDWKTVEAIGQKLGRPPGAVYQRARDLGLLGERIKRHGTGAAAVAAARSLNKIPPEHRNGLLSAANEPANRVPPLTDFLGQSYALPLQQASDQR